MKNKIVYEEKNGNLYVENIKMKFIWVWAYKIIHNINYLQYLWRCRGRKGGRSKNWKENIINESVMLRLCYLREDLGIQITDTVYSSYTATDSIPHSSFYLSLYLFTSPALWHTCIKNTYDVTSLRHYLHLDDELLS